MERQTPSGFPGNFRKRKVLGTLWFPSGLPETLVQAKPRTKVASAPAEEGVNRPCVYRRLQVHVVADRMVHTQQR